VLRLFVDSKLSDNERIELSLLPPPAVVNADTLGVVGIDKVRGTCIHINSVGASTINICM